MGILTSGVMVARDVGERPAPVYCRLGPLVQSTAVLVMADDPGHGAVMGCGRLCTCHVRGLHSEPWAKPPQNASEPLCM
jgi:hypothetical protein